MRGHANVEHTNRAAGRDLAASAAGAGARSLASLVDGAAAGHGGPRVRRRDLRLAGAGPADAHRALGGLRPGRRRAGAGPGGLRGARRDRPAALDRPDRRDQRAGRPGRPGRAGPGRRRPGALHRRLGGDRRRATRSGARSGCARRCRERVADDRQRRAFAAVRRRPAGPPARGRAGRLVDDRLLRGAVGPYADRAVVPTPQPSLPSRGGWRVKRDGWGSVGKGSA